MDWRLSDPVYTGRLALPCAAGSPGNQCQGTPAKIAKIGCRNKDRLRAFSFR